MWNKLKSKFGFSEVIATRSVCIIFVYLIILGLRLLVVSKTGEVILSPWQVINKYYIYLFWLATLSAGLLVAFSNLKTKWLILILSLNSFLLFSYLPLTHQLIYGADGWRHLAEVNRILNGGAWHEVAAGGGGIMSLVGQVAYAGFWWLVAGLAWILGIGGIDVLRWLQPVLAAAVLPVSVFWLARTLSLGRRMSLLTAWFCSFPFALQSAGSFSLPVNLWLLIFLPLLTILLNEFKRELPRRNILFVSLVVLCFGYTMYPILYFIAWVVAEFLAYHHRRDVARYVSTTAMSLAMGGFNRRRDALQCVSTIGVGLVIPVIELFQPGSKLVNWAGVFSGSKQIIGNITGWYLANGPRVHDIATGNIFFNQIPADAFVPNLLTAWRGWIVIFMLVFLAVSLFGIYKLFRSKFFEQRVFAIFGLALSISYFIGRYFIIGEQLISRRLDAVLALVFIIGFMIAKERMIDWTEKKKISVLPNLITFLLLASLATAASYSLGPDTQTVGVPEYRAMQNIWSEESNQSQHCVIAGTYPLLALEAISAKQIVGGGFPINSNFGQSERVNLWETLSQGVAPKSQNSVQLLQSKKSCWFVGSGQDVKQAETVLDKIFAKRVSEISAGEVVAVKFSN